MGCMGEVLNESLYYLDRSNKGELLSQEELNSTQDFFLKNMGKAGKLSPTGYAGLPVLRLRPVFHVQEEYVA